MYKIQLCLLLLIFFASFLGHAAKHPGYVLNIHTVDTNAPQNRPKAITTQDTSDVVAFEGCPSYGFAAWVLVNHVVFEMFLDTGSATTVVPGVDCTHCPGVPVLFSPFVNTSIDLGVRTQAVYGGGANWTGIVWSDVVTVGGEGVFPSVRMKVAVVDSEFNFFVNRKCDPTNQLPPYGALLGLGPPEIAAPSTQAWTQALFAAETSLPKIIAFQLCVKALSGYGRLWVGTSDPTSYSGTLLTTPLHYTTPAPPFYKIIISSIKIDATEVVSTSAQYAIDTGTTLTLLPVAAFNSLKSAIESSNYYTTLGWGTNFFGGSTCQSATGLASPANIDNLPAVTLVLEGFTVSLPASQSYLIPYGDYWCSGIAGTNGLVIFGASWMAGLTVVIDIDGGHVGMATAANCGTSAPAKPSGNFQYDGGDSLSSSASSSSVVSVIAAAAAVILASFVRFL